VGHMVYFRRVVSFSVFYCPVKLTPAYFASAPSALTSKCLALQRTRRPYRIILHGESIGGMVACHLARHRPVDALVCDRTFASLDATAARLMVSVHHAL
jgi:hypothetical protein